MKKYFLFLFVFFLFFSCKHSLTSNGSTNESMKKNKECEIYFNLPFSATNHSRSLISASSYDIDDVTFYRAKINGQNTDGIAYSLSKDFYKGDETKLILKEEGTFVLSITAYYNYGTVDKIIGSGTSESFVIEYGDSKNIDISITAEQRPSYSIFKLKFSPKFSRLYEDSYIKKDVSYYKLDYIYQLKVVEDPLNTYQTSSFNFCELLPSVKSNNAKLYYGKYTSSCMYLGTFNELGKIPYLLKKCKDIDDRYKEGAGYINTSDYEYSLFYSVDNGTNKNTLISSSSGRVIVQNGNYKITEDLVYYSNDTIEIPYYDYFDKVKIYYILTPYTEDGICMANSVGGWLINPDADPTDNYAKKVFTFSANNIIEQTLSPTFNLYHNPNYDESDTDIDIGVNVTWNNP